MTLGSRVIEIGQGKRITLTFGSSRASRGCRVPSFYREPFVFPSSDFS